MPEDAPLPNAAPELVDSYRRLADVFHAGRQDGPEDVGWVADPAWRPSSRLAARMELEG